MTITSDMLRKALGIILAAVLFSAGSNPARAEWFEVSSDHFVIYGEGREASMRRFSEQLERFHNAMAAVTGRREPPPSPSNRVTIFIVDNAKEVQNLARDGLKRSSLRGFYRSRAGASIAVVPRITGGTDDIFDPSMVTLLHEYAHHFLLSANAYALPRWVSEGAAEFFASASFGRDGAVQIGKPNKHRAFELALALDVTATDLLDPESYEKRRAKTKGYDAFYGKSWVLYHYLNMGKVRDGQMGRYLALMRSGKASREAALEVFGDLTVLEKELDAYLKKPRLLAYDFKPGQISAGTITLRRLTAGEVAIMPVVLRSRNGVNAEEAQEVLVDARRIADLHKDDPAVLAALAEAEFDAGNNAQALAAADGALKLTPNLVNAHVQKGYALFRLAEAGSDPAAFRKTRAAWVALNRIENDHPLPLIYFYRSFRAQGNEPTPLSVQGLSRAAELAPYDLGLRMTLAMQLLSDGQQGLARQHLQPIATNPHAGGLARHAQRLIERLDRQPDWRGQEALAASDGEEDDPAD